MIITVILVLAAVLIPRFSAVQGARVAAAARSIASDIRYAQSCAVAQCINHRAVFSPGTSYSIQKQNDDGTWSVIQNPTSPGDYTVSIGSDYPQVVIDSSFIVEFSPLGEAVSGGGSGFTVSNSGSSPVATITIDQYTGNVEVRVS